MTVGAEGGLSGKNLTVELNDFYSTLSLRLNLLEQARRSLNEFLSRDFNVFDYIEPVENTLSRVIADLLNPDGPHGQGSVFLNEFLALIDHAKLQSDAARARVQCQTMAVCDGKLGFIDITIDLGGFGIGIENKPTAVEQENQLERYCRHLNARHNGKFCLVFLDGRGSEIKSISAEDRRKLEGVGQFKVITYVPDLTSWLDNCFKECRAEKLRWFLRDFKGYIERMFGVPYEEGVS